MGYYNILGIELGITKSGENQGHRLKHYSSHAEQEKRMLACPALLPA